MSLDTVNCSLCEKTFASYKTLNSHLKYVHRSSEVLTCSSSKCNYTSLYRGDMNRHSAKCFHVRTDLELSRLQQQHESEIITYRETISRLQIYNQEIEMKLQSASELSTQYRESVIRMQVEINLLREQLAKAERLVEKAIDRPGTINNINNTQQIGTLEISNNPRLLENFFPKNFR